jgi:hypothetical protein
MKTLTFFLLIMLQNDSPEQVIQKQLEAYNQRDIEAFMKLFHDQAQVFSYGNPDPIAADKAQVRMLYQNLFDRSPYLKSQLINRIVMGNKVLDHEYITGRMGSKEPVELMVIYEVNEGLITRCEVIRP